jgi:hypothetical protein
MINAAGARILDAEGAKAGIFLWDSPRNRLALKVAVKGDANSFAISAANVTATIRAKTFLDYIRWCGSKNESLPAVWKPKERMFEVSIPTHLIAAKAGSWKGLR